MGLWDALSGLFGDDGGADESGDPSGGAPAADEGDPDSRGAGESDAPDDVADYGPAEFAAEAREFAERHEDLPLDFGVGSLEALDDYAAGQGEVVGVLGEEMDDDDGLLADLQGGYTLWLGSYLGEVLVRQFDGEWRRDDGWTVAVPLEGGTLAVPVFDVAARSIADEPRFARLAADLADGLESAAAAERVAGADAESPWAAEAAELATFWSEYDLDVTPASLARLDDLVDDQWGSERFRTATVGGDGEEDRVFTGLVQQLGSYYGEVLVRHLDGEWIEHEDLGTAVELGSTSPRSRAREDAVEHGSTSPQRAEDAVGREASDEPSVAGAPEDAVDPTGEGEAVAVANVFHVAADCLTEPSKFALSFDTVADQLDRDRERVGEGGQVVTADADEWFGGEADGAHAVNEADGADAVDGAGNAHKADETEEAGDADPAPGDDEATASSGAAAGRGAAAAASGSTAATDPLDGEDLASRFGAEAADLVEQWPGYGLDYGPESLERLDRLVAEEFAEFDFSDVALGAEADGDSLFLTARAMEAGGYLAEVLRRNLGGEWVDDEGTGFVVAGRDGEARLDPVGVAAAVFRGEDSFAATYEALRGRLSIPERDDPTDGEERRADRAVRGEPDDRDDPLSGIVEAFAAEHDADDTDAGDVDDTDTGDADGPDAGGGEGSDPVIDRLSAKAAVDAAGEDLAREPAADVGEDRRAAAEDLADDWPAYDLDGSVESLARLDALVAAEYDRSGGDRDYDGDPLAVPEGTKLSIPTDGSVDAFGGYLAGVFERHHWAEWRRTDDGDVVLVVEGESAAAELEPEMVAIACFAGESSFVDAYARVAADLGLEPPIGR